jgi:endonuclease/exonuclease/phosphatase family metal-dependent hydrolase
MQIKILSWNIWGGQHLSEIKNFLRETDADIIGLQEVIQDLDGSKNTAKIIADELGYRWSYAPTREIDTAKLYKILEPRRVMFGNAILSKYKLGEVKAHELSEEKKSIVLEAPISVSGKILHVFSTHLVHTHQEPSELQDLQAKNLLKFIPKENAVLMGDFNALPESNAIKMISGVMTNAANTIRPTWSLYEDGCHTCRLGNLRYCLDYIFVTKDIVINSFEIGNSKASDHLPISAIIEV